MNKYDVLYILVIPINMFYHFSYKYLYEKNKTNEVLPLASASAAKQINDFKDYNRASNIDILSRCSASVKRNS